MAGVTVQPAYVQQVIGTHTQNTSLSSVVSVTVPALANGVIIGAQTKSVFFTLDGTDPTDTKGFILVADQAATLVPVYSGQVLKFIEAAASAKLDYQFVKMGG